MKKEKLIQLEQNDLEIINSSIIVAKNASLHERNYHYFSKKFVLDKLTKKYHLTEFYLKEDNLNKFTCATVEIVTWLHIKIGENLKNSYSALSKEDFNYRVALYIVDKIKDLKNFKFNRAKYNIMGVYDYLVFDEKENNYISIVEEKQGYSVYIRELIKPTKYL